MNKLDERNRLIFKCNIAGIVMNFILGLAKVIVGIAIRAHAIIIDGINSLTDMSASAVSVGSVLLANKESDKSHPLGYGRVEYIASFLITIVVIYIGVVTSIGTIQAIIHPHEAPSYNTGVIVLMVISMVVKMVYGIRVRNYGIGINSIALKMTGSDTLADSLVSLAILIAIIIYKTTGVDIEHYVCLVISLLVIMTAVRMTVECMNKILGTRIDSEYRKKIIGMISMEEDVLNVSNLIIHNYGENNYVGSVEIEVDENMKASEIAKLSRKIINRAGEEDLILTAVGISAANISDPRASMAWDKIISIITKHPEFIRAHSFTIDFDEKNISFCVVENYEIKDREKAYDEVLKEVKEAFPDMHIDISKGIDM